MSHLSLPEHPSILSFFKLARWKVFALALMLFSFRAGAVTLLFDNQTTFNSQFPTQFIQGGDSSVTLITSPSRVRLYAKGAEGDTGNFRTMIYSTTSANYDFLSGSKSFSFDNVQFSTSSGSTYNGYLGVFSGNANVLTAPGGPDDGIYFHLDRVNSQLKLVARQNGAVSTLYTFTASGWTFTKLSFTLTGSTWSASVTYGSNSPQTASGSFATAFDAANWGTNFYLGLASFQSSSNTTRYADLQLQQISVNAVPEPGTVALLSSGALAGVILLARKHKAGTR